MSAPLIPLLEHGTMQRHAAEILDRGRGTG
jgi:hypothetical protein